MTTEYQDLRIQLENVAEQLGDRIIDALRVALEGGAERRPPEEKVLSRARTAAEKAARLLATLEES